MKTLPNSGQRLVSWLPASNGVNPTFTMSTLVVADAGGATKRTRVKNFAAVARNVNAIAGIFNNLLVGVISTKEYNKLIFTPIPETGDFSTPIDTVIDKSVLVVSVDATRINSPSIASSVNSNVLADVVVPLDEYAATMCGTDFYIWVSGGSFSADVRVVMDVERVEITQDEYMKYYAGVC